MISRFRRLAAKKNAKREKTGFFVRVRESGLLSRMRRLIPPSFSQPHLITISTKGLTDKQIEVLKEMERRGLIPKITWIESSPNSFDDKMKFALLYLHSDEAQTLGCQMRKGYDYAWIKIAMDCKVMPERYDKYKSMSTPKFVEYIKSLGFTDIAGSKMINKVKEHAKWLSESNIIFFYRVHLSIPERERRNRIALKFLEIMNEI